MRYNEIILSEDWNKLNRKDKTDGMSSKAVKAYRRENPGSKLKTAVTTKPSKLKSGSKAAKRRKSFCARMSGNKGPMKKPNGKPTPKALALRRWNCESIEEMRELIETAERIINEEKQRLDPSCWKGYKKQGTKMKGGVRVNNCVPNESMEEESTYIITAKNDDGRRKKFRVKAPSERAAVEKFTIHNNRAMILKVTREETPFGNTSDTMKNLKIREQDVEENFADGRNPQDKGDSKRHGIDTKASVSSLRNTAKEGGRKGQLAHWLANMKSGKDKK